MVLAVLGAGREGRGGGGAQAAGVRVANCSRRSRGGHDHHVVVDGCRLGIAGFCLVGDDV